MPGLAALEAATARWAEAIAFVEEGDAALAEAIRAGDAERVRDAAPDRVPAAILAAAREPGRYVARAPVLAEGRIELLWYLREQSISHDYHRYGNLGEHGAAGRAPVG
jgi:RHH-type proline utilization regulon transcriptional repressor/proline dehydrogenase/delta 1-pyrroline-5-carboxylate dehydrogenase